MFCKHCGFKNNESSKFCIKCGKAIDLEHEKLNQKEVDISSNNEIGRKRIKKIDGINKTILISSFVLLFIIIGFFSIIKYVNGEDANNEVGKTEIEETNYKSEIKSENIDVTNKISSKMEEKEEIRQDSKNVSNKAIQNIDASSYYIEKTKNNTFRHVPGNIIDGSYETAWVESVDGYGEGEWIQINLDGEYKINQINFNNGYKKSEDLYYKNSRIKNLRVEFSDGSYQDVLLDDNFSLVNIIKPQDVETSYIRFIILDAYEGSKYQDTCITEIGIQ